MYFPYVRGKQFELIAVREMAQLLAASKITPIIEPVKESLGNLERTLDTVRDVGGSAILIVNPRHGDLSEDGISISSLLGKFIGTPNIVAGILLKNNMTVDNIIGSYQYHKIHNPTLIHAGFSDGKILSEKFGDTIRHIRHAFIDKNGGKLYYRHFPSTERMLIRDGFERRPNRDHPLLEKFSDLHVTYREEGMSGFGDFLIVGDDYSESGGPAYTVAIHLTFIDQDKDDEMYIYHFKSRRQDTPTDPAGKFSEALALMIETLDEPRSKILETDAIKEFRDLHAKQHFPGLGYIKKLSMKHHIETIAKFLN